MGSQDTRLRLVIEFDIPLATNFVTSKKATPLIFDAAVGGIRSHLKKCLKSGLSGCRVGLALALVKGR